ncbi:TonB-linked SusC/RagA family outer membrane protein [Catalinimonas alkaloidigena]|uniref:SusC/RagA family TonB-linked outer membrane protein n=1 Tax=Catalinimonas alkaloidigena TaxID=1075417 RepID=UPI00240511A1|nr:TonB-dependent receptor [Catalinimonas alkaloidigena]MDF9798898.1 TonB-linked SusC/RagA family outer membrane protein [Catalinimonas alkaloidigena]
MKQFFYCLFFALLAHAAVGQGINVSGTVTSVEDNMPLPGVNVIVQGTGTGAVTNINGEYSLEVPSSKSILVFSFVGYISQEVTVGNSNTIDVNLSADQAQLDEVVVIGYGTQKKSDLTGAVSRVDGESIQNKSYTQVTEMLSGQVAGIYANQSPSPAGGGAMEVRGPTSLTGGTDPLIVLDGVIFNGNIADINPNDIEHIDVLKDASSAAVYGSKAASGVVIITTKKGERGKPTINFTAKTGVSLLTNYDFRPRNAAEYEDFRRDYFRTVGIANREDWYWDDPNDLRSGVTLEQWRNANPNPNPDDTQEYLGRLNFFNTEIDQYLAGETVNWFDEIIRPGLRQNYDLSVGGGAENFNYYWSIGYVDNEGVIAGDDFTAIRTRLNVDFAVTDWLNVGVNAQYTHRDQSTVPASMNFSSISPYSRIYDEDNKLEWYPHGYSIVTNPLINYYGQEKYDRTHSLFAAMFADVALPFGFNYRVSFQPRMEFAKDYNFWDSETIVGGRTYLDGYGTREDGTLNAWMIDNILSWNQQFGVHAFDVTLLYNAEQTKTYNSYGENQTFLPNQQLGYNGLQFGSKPLVSTNDTEAGGEALMARLNYTLLDRYLLTASVRRDGYSAFGQEHPTATFPAAALAWKISDESFYNSELVNRLKLRLSWGVNGNRDIGIYSALAQIGSELYYDGTNVQMGLYNNTLANPGLRWERTESFNIGVDMGLLDDRIDLSANVYDMRTTDLLMSRKLPEITGFTSIISNLGELSNRGMELSLNTVNISNQNLSWKSSFVFSLNRNKIESLFGDYEEVEVNGETITREIPDYTNLWFPDEAIDVVWEYDVVGVWQLDEASEAAEYNMVPGDYKAVDVDDSKTYDALVDKQFIGYEQPRYRLGLRNDFSFLKDFTASVFIRADLGHIGAFDYAVHESSTYDRINIWNIPYWTPTNGNNEYARTSEVHGAYGGGLRIFKPRSFVRVQDISLAYNIPMTFAERINVNSLRIFVSARNLFTFTDWPGWDPETGLSGTADGPMPKTFSVGVNISL